MLKLLSRTQAAARRGVCERTLVREITSGEQPAGAVRVGDRVVGFVESDFDAWLKHRLELADAT